MLLFQSVGDDYKLQTIKSAETCIPVPDCLPECRDDRVSCEASPCKAPSFKVITESSDKQNQAWLLAADKAHEPETD